MDVCNNIPACSVPPSVLEGFPSEVHRPNNLLMGPSRLDASDGATEACPVAQVELSGTVQGEPLGLGTASGEGGRPNGSPLERSESEALLLVKTLPSPEQRTSIVKRLQSSKNYG